MIARDEPRMVISQGRSAVRCFCSFNHSCAEGKRIASVFVCGVCFFFFTGRTFLFCFYLKIDWKELLSNCCQKANFWRVSTIWHFSPKDKSGKLGCPVTCFQTPSEIQEQVFQNITGGNTKSHLKCLLVAAL